MSHEEERSRLGLTESQVPIVRDNAGTSLEIDHANAQADASAGEESNNGDPVPEIAEALAQIRAERARLHERIDCIYQLRVRAAWEAANSICPILHEPMFDPWRTPCGHIFCFNCIWKWLGDHGSCPICRRQVRREDLVELATVDLDPFGAIQPQAHTTTQSALSNTHSRQRSASSALEMYSSPARGSAENTHTSDSGAPTANEASVPGEQLELYTILDEGGRYWAVSSATDRAPD